MLVLFVSFAFALSLLFLSFSLCLASFCLSLNSDSYLLYKMMHENDSKWPTDTSLRVAMIRFKATSSTAIGLTTDQGLRIHSEYTRFALRIPKDVDRLPGSLSKHPFCETHKAPSGLMRSNQCLGNHSVYHNADITGFGNRYRHQPIIFLLSTLLSFYCTDNPFRFCTVFHLLWLSEQTVAFTITKTFKAVLAPE
ncbi:hypothetical protein BY458DRAFT_494314 [Sporodiniella umbellata]|nr:hypothetical protein BY458DRAFT_494314 [Sporodiniella umbellata]